MIVGDAGGGALYVFHQAFEIAAGVRDGNDAEGGVIPEIGGIEFGDGDVEGSAQAVFEATHDLALVLEGVGSFDAEFEGKGGDH